MKILSIVLLVLVPLSGYSHGVHDSGSAKPQKGGTLESLETIHLEFLQIKDEIQIYIFDKSKKPQPLLTKDYPVSAKAILPKKGGSKPLKLIAKKNYWTTKFSAPKTHRYDLELSIEQGGHKDKVLYTVETKK